MTQQERIVLSQILPKEMRKATHSLSKNSFIPTTLLIQRIYYQKQIWYSYRLYQISNCRKINLDQLGHNMNWVAMVPHYNLFTTTYLNNILSLNWVSARKLWDHCSQPIQVKQRNKKQFGQKAAQSNQDTRDNILRSKRISEINVYSSSIA